MGRFAPSEMEIVDAFTRVIFCGSDELSAQEASIVHTLCEIDQDAARCFAENHPGALGAYLRALGVNEMIRLVGQVRDCNPPQEAPPARTRSLSGKHRPAQF